MEYTEAKSNIELPQTNDLIKRFAEIQSITYAEAEALVGAETDDEIMKKITDFTVTKINGGVKLNRAQRRALAKKNKGNKAKVAQKSQIDEINETATKLNYIDLIQKLRKLNEEKAKENEEDGTATIEDN
jgi:hypothetical protein